MTSSANNGTSGYHDAAMMLLTPPTSPTRKHHSQLSLSSMHTSTSSFDHGNLGYDDDLLLRRSVLEPMQVFFSPTIHRAADMHDTFPLPLSSSSSSPELLQQLPRSPMFHIAGSDADDDALVPNGDSALGEAMDADVELAPLQDDVSACPQVPDVIMQDDSNNVQDNDDAVVPTTCPAPQTVAVPEIATASAGPTARRAESTVSTTSQLPHMPSMFGGLMQALTSGTSAPSSPFSASLNTPGVATSAGTLVSAPISNANTPQPPSPEQQQVEQNALQQQQQQQQQQVQQQQQNVYVPRPKPPPATPSPGYTVKRACQPSDKRCPPNAIQRCFHVERDELGLIEYRLKSSRDAPRMGACVLCDPDTWTFNGSQYDPFLTLLYAERDGCIPSSVVTTYPKFIVPWRYKNKRTGEITWKIFHLSGDKITSADSETIVVNPAKDVKLRNVMRRAAAARPRFSNDVDLVEYLLRIVRDTLGDYGLPGGPTSADADARLYQQMVRQGHNLMMLCEVEIGLCRHKALLFKVLCDIVDLNCALVTGYSTAGRHQWNIITLDRQGDFLIDPTSPHFTWTTKGSHRTKGYRVTTDTSFGHSGFTQKEAGII